MLEASSRISSYADIAVFDDWLVSASGSRIQHASLSTDTVRMSQATRNITPSVGARREASLHQVKENDV